MRTIQNIFDELVAAKDANNELGVKLTSTSAVAIWRLLFYLIAVVIWIHEGLFYKHKNEVEERIKNAFAGTIPWYHRKSMEFQYGDAIEIFDNGQVGYSVIDETKQIVKHAAIVEIGNFLTVKIAKENMAELTIQEDGAFKEYMKKIKFAGTKTSVVNVPSDMLVIEIKIWYDPLILSATGHLLQDSLVFPVREAIFDYINKIIFGGTLVKSKLVDACQAASGVCDVELIQVQARKFNASYANITQNIYTSYSGKFKIDQLNITYEPCNIV